MKERDKPYFWATWLTPLLAGEDNCEAKVWWKAHYQDLPKLPRDSDFATWMENHTFLLNELGEVYGPPAAQKLLKEGQTSWKIDGNTATLAGKMDLISIKPNLVIDAKSGKQKDSHVLQMKLYLLAIEMGAVKGVKGKFTAILRYNDGTKIEVKEIGEDFKDRLFTLIKRLAGNMQLPTVPSKFECKFCDIGNCADRFVGDDEPATRTDHF